jgi:hypothetical protein
MYKPVNGMEGMGFEPITAVHGMYKDKEDDDSTIEFLVFYHSYIPLP